MSSSWQCGVSSCEVLSFLIQNSLVGCSAVSQNKDLRKIPGTPAGASLQLDQFRGFRVVNDLELLCIPLDRLARADRECAEQDCFRERTGVAEIGAGLCSLLDGVQPVAVDTPGSRKRLGNTLAGVCAIFVPSGFRIPMFIAM